METKKIESTLKLRAMKFYGNSVLTLFSTYLKDDNYKKQTDPKSDKRGKVS